MDVEILYVPDCRNLDRARQRPREALDVVGVNATVRETEVSTPDGAVRVGMRGSPTLLIRGRDPFATAGDPTSVSCRLYRADGATDGAPSVEQIVAALLESEAM